MLHRYLTSIPHLYVKCDDLVYTGLLECFSLGDRFCDIFSKYIFIVSTDSALSYARDLGAPDTFARDLGAHDTYHIEEIFRSYIFMYIF